MEFSASDRQAIDQVVRLLEQSRSLLFITGAGALGQTRGYPPTEASADSTT